MPSDFSHLETAGMECVGCGKSRDQVLLQRLNTYARSLACWDCFRKHINCADCNHDHLKQKTLCPQCGCTVYRHGLEGEFDRQFAAAVGKAPTQAQCHGLGGRECLNMVLAAADGSIRPFCVSCETIWIQETLEVAREVKAKLKIDTDIGLPQ
jgi:hypothetical protein